MKKAFLRDLRFPPNAPHCGRFERQVRPRWLLTSAVSRAGDVAGVGSTRRRSDFRSREIGVGEGG